MALDTGTRLGPYEILAPLGAGGMGEVYRARDTRLDRQVAIAFTAFDAQNQPAISVCDLDACASRKTFSAAGTETHWMPDGKALAYIDPKTQSDLWAQPIDGSAPRQLTHFPADGERIWDFAWSADGKRLAVARARIASDIVLFRGLRKQ